MLTWRLKVIAITCAALNYHFSTLAQDQSCSRVLHEFLQTIDPQLTQEDKKTIIPCIFQTQNRGFLLDEKECKYDSAVIKIELALDAWVHLGDTLSQANLLKYLGYLNGRLGQFSTAKNQIKQAENLYMIKNAAFGVAVSQYDLARVYTFENKLDSAVYYVEKAKNYWMAENVASRILVLNNHLVHIATLGAPVKNTGSLIPQNQKLLKSPDLYWQHELDFYFTAAQYYTATNNTKLASRYSSKYKKKSGRPGEDGISIQYSLYDPLNCQ